MSDLVALKVSNGSDTRRISVRASISFSDLVRDLLELFLAPAGSDARLKYLDEDNDLVTLTSDRELKEAMRLHKNGFKIQLDIIAGTGRKSNQTFAGVAGKVQTLNRTSAVLSSGKLDAQRASIIPSGNHDAAPPLKRSLSEQKRQEDPYASSGTSDIGELLRLLSLGRESLGPELHHNVKDLLLSGDPALIAEAQSILEGHNARSVARPSANNASNAGRASSLTKTYEQPIDAPREPDARLARVSEENLPLCVNPTTLSQADCNGDGLVSVLDLVQFLVRSGFSRQQAQQAARVFVNNVQPLQCTSCQRVLSPAQFSGVSWRQGGPPGSQCQRCKNELGWPVLSGRFTREEMQRGHEMGQYSVIERRFDYSTDGTKVRLTVDGNTYNTEMTNLWEGWLELTDVIHKVKWYVDLKTSCAQEDKPRELVNRPSRRTRELSDSRAGSGPTAVPTEYKVPLGEFATDWLRLCYFLVLQRVREHLGTNVGGGIGNADDMLEILAQVVDLNSAKFWVMELFEQMDSNEDGHLSLQELLTFHNNIWNMKIVLDRDHEKQKLIFRDIGRQRILSLPGNLEPVPAKATTIGFRTEDRDRSQYEGKSHPVHTHPLVYRAKGGRGDWMCNGNDLVGGCRSGFERWLDIYPDDPRWTCVSCAKEGKSFNLCEACFADKDPATERGRRRQLPAEEAMTAEVLRRREAFERAERERRENLERWF